jgi:hypothetical protein
MKLTQTTSSRICVFQDFEGQRLADTLATTILLAAGVRAFLELNIFILI